MGGNEPPKGEKSPRAMSEFFKNNLREREYLRRETVQSRTEDGKKTQTMMGSEEKEDIPRPTGDQAKTTKTLRE